MKKKKQRDEKSVLKQSTSGLRHSEKRQVSRCPLGKYGIIQWT